MQYIKCQTIKKLNIMKNLSIFKTVKWLLVPLVLITLGVVNAWADSWSWTPSSTSSISGTSSNVTLSSKAWTVTRSADKYIGYYSDYGIQFGSKKAGAETVTFSSSAFTGTITSIAVNCGSYNMSHTLSVKVNNTAYSLSGTIGNGSTTATVTATGSSSGSIEIKLTAGDRACYIKSITITYTTGSGKTLSYDANGADGGTTPTGGSYVSGATVTVVGNTGSLYKYGHTFAGWNTAANGSGAGYTAGNTFSITANTTLYAQWTNTYGGQAFTLVEDAAELSAGSKIVLINPAHTYAMSRTQNTNNRALVAYDASDNAGFSMSGDNKTATLGSATTVQVITLENLATPATDTYQFNVESGYLYAPGSSSSNYLKTRSPNSDADGHWLINMDSIKAIGTSTNNTMQFNSTSLISCYAKRSQTDVLIYAKDIGTKYSVTWNKNGYGTAPTRPASAVKVTLPDISTTGVTNTGWTADKAVTNMSTSANISAGTAITPGTRVQLGANTTFTAQWETATFTISTSFTNITVSSAFPTSFTYTGATTTDLNRTLSVSSSYALPSDLTVTMGGKSCTNGTEYTYSSSTGAFSFNVAITGDISISGTALNKYTITLNPGNGSLTAGSGWSADGDNLVQVVVQGNNITMPYATSGCAGWSFVGWNEDTSVSNVSSNPVDQAGGATFAPAATKTYYAVYRASTPTGTTYTKITDEVSLLSGDYAIVGYTGSAYYAMGNEISSGHMTESSSGASSPWTNSNADYIWTVIKVGDKVAFYNADAGKFLTIVDGAWVLADDGQKFSYSFNSTTAAWTFTSPSGKQMAYDSYFYTRDAQVKDIYLYKRGYTESGNYYTSPSCASLTVTGTSNPVGAATVSLTSTTAKSGDVIWATYTLNRGYTFNSWDKSGTGASLSSTSADFTKLTVGSENATVTAKCDALTSYTLKYHDGDGNHTMTVYEGENILSILPEPSESCDDDSPDFVGWSTSEIRTKTNTKPTFVSSSAVINSTTAAQTYYAVYADSGNSGDYTSTFNFQVSSGPGSPWSDASHGGASWSYSNVTFATTASCGMPNGATLTVTLPSGSIANSFTINGTSNAWSTSKVSVAVTGDGIVGNITTFNNKGYSYDFTASNNDVLEYTFTSTTTDSKVAYIASIAFDYTINDYKGFITTCCEEPTFTIGGTGKTVTDGKISFPVLREDLGGASSSTWAELSIAISSNSTGAITILETSSKTAWKLSSWESRAETGGTAAVEEHATFTNPSSGNYLFKVKTTSGQTGQGTYRIGIHQAADATYCEATVYLWVDVTLRDKFVDNVNGNTTINVDGHGSTTTTPTESSLDADKDDDCHSTTRRLVGWVKETDMDSWYGTGQDRTRDLDDKTANITAPGATITTSGATWYAIWGIEE